MSTNEFNVPQFKFIKKIVKKSQEGVVEIGVFNNTIKSACKVIRLEKIASSIEKEIGNDLKNQREDKIIEIKDSISSEVLILSSLKHPHLVRILAHGALPLEIGRPETVYYIMMEFAEGTSLLNEIKTKELSETDVLIALRQIFESVYFMHRFGISHLDLKPDNIFLSARQNIDGSYEINVTIIDLGSAIVISKEQLRQQFTNENSNLFTELNNRIIDTIRSKKRVLVRYDRKYFWSKESNDAIYTRLLDRKLVQKQLFPYKDLYSLGKIIEELLQIETFKPSYQTRVGLNEISKHLIETAKKPDLDGYYLKRSGGNKYLAIFEAMKDLERIDPSYLSIVEIPELSSEIPKSEGIMLMDQMVYFTNKVQGIIMHPYFNRLFFFTQLEFEYLAYPDAKYSRGTHSLLVFDLTRKAVQSLLSNIKFKLAATPEMIRGAIIYGLIHDMGHYTLSHMFEDFDGMYGVLSDDELLYKLLFYEEKDITGSRGYFGFLKDPKSFSNLIVKVFNEKVLEVIKAISACVNNDRKTLKQLMHNDEEKIYLIRVLSGLLSSAVDVDKIAYLLHDSKSSGAKYGLAVDPEVFFSALTFIPFDSLRDIRNSEFENKELPLLFLKEWGLNTAETIILGRYWMLSRVYWHRTNRAMMAESKFMILVLIEYYEKRKINYFRQFLKDCYYFSETQGLEYLSESFDDNVMKVDKNDKFYNPLRKIAKERDRESIYIRLLTIGSTGAMTSSKEIKRDKKAYSKLTKIAEKGKELELTYAITDTISTIIRKELPNLYKSAKDKEKLKELFFFDKEKEEYDLKYGTICVDLPRKKRDKLFVNNIILVPDNYPGVTPKELGKRSRILGSKGETIEEEFLEETKKYRIYSNYYLYSNLRSEKLRYMLREGIYEAINRTYETVVKKIN